MYRRLNVCQLLKPVCNVPSTLALDAASLHPDFLCALSYITLANLVKGQVAFADALCWCPGFA